MNESDRPAQDDSSDRTFNEEQKQLFESHDAPDKTRRRTPGTQSVPPSGRAEEDGEAPPGVGGVG